MYREGPALDAATRELRTGTRQSGLSGQGLKARHEAGYLSRQDGPRQASWLAGGSKEKRGLACRGRHPALPTRNPAVLTSGQKGPRPSDEEGAEIRKKKAAKLCKTKKSNRHPKDSARKALMVYTLAIDAPPLWIPSAVATQNWPGGGSVKHGLGLAFSSCAGKLGRPNQVDCRPQPCRWLCARDVWRESLGLRVGSRESRLRGSRRRAGSFGQLLISLFAVFQGVRIGRESALLRRRIDGNLDVE